MKETLTKNLGLKILALCVSFLLWILVANFEDPIDKKTFVGIPVSVTHKEIVTNRANTYRIAEESKNVSVTVWAVRSVLQKIRPEDILAVADMRNLETRTRSLIPVEVTLPKYSGDYKRATSNPPNIQVTIEPETTERFVITTQTSGTLRDGYEIGSAVADPKNIEISGPESVVASIEKVVAEVNVSGLSKDTEMPAELVLYDSNGRVIDNTLIDHNLGEEGLSVKVKLLHSKSVPVRFDTSGIKPADGYSFNGITVRPDAIHLIGSNDQLDSLDYIKIPAKALNETELTDKVERTVDITDYLPSWARTDDESKRVNILVTIDITKYGTKAIEFPVGSISLLNVTPECKVDFGDVGAVRIIVRGSKNALKNFELEPGSVAINLVDLKEAGTYTVPLQVILKDGIELEEDLSIDINLTENSGGEND